MAELSHTGGNRDRILQSASNLGVRRLPRGGRGRRHIGRGPLLVAQRRQQRVEHAGRRGRAKHGGDRRGDGWPRACKCPREIELASTRKKKPYEYIVIER